MSPAAAPALAPLPALAAHDLGAALAPSLTKRKVLWWGDDGYGYGGGQYNNNNNNNNGVPYRNILQTCNLWSHLRSVVSLTSHRATPLKSYSWRSRRWMGRFLQ